MYLPLVGCFPSLYAVDLCRNFWCRDEGYSVAHSLASPVQARWWVIVRVLYSIDDSEST
ncbi:hypothetical protein DPMN_101131 [Dreissena polymorpha]|uniref:Uncharacterized protein n=1 Tax=Dreissena polymorpha TaxID=45954 RepID=A0A9D4LKI7_DREPO|nr:hypothetical protein DPMN_101131 [Dreissena polymorpha]